MCTGATVIPNMVVHPEIVSSLGCDRPSMEVMLKSRVISVLSVSIPETLLKNPKIHLSQPSAQSLPPPAYIEYISTEGLSNVGAAHQTFLLLNHSSLWPSSR